MNPIASHLLVFLVGIAGGAAAAYYAELFSDRRRAKESAKQESENFKQAESQMPELFAEMRADLRSPDLCTHRDFFVVSKGAILCLRGQHLVYHTDVHTNLIQKVTVLENLGYVHDITPGNAPLFRMSEDFVRLLLTS